MSSSDRGRGGAPETQHPRDGSPASATDPSDPSANWLDRMQRARARHSAITRNLNTWSSYKSWADRVRDAWDGDETPPGANGAGGGKGTSR
jgi:hypothetical protein